MKSFRSKVLMAAAAALALGGSAQAAVTITNSNTTAIPAGFTAIATFDAANALGYTFDVAPDVFTGASPGIAAPPPGDATAYMAVLQGKSITLSTPVLLSAFSFYMGSPDSYNSVRFQGANGFDVTYSGAALAGLPVVVANGDQGVGRTIVYNFGADRVNKITFASSGYSFEVDNLAGLASAVPEPATWGMMILGFGLMGAALRRRKAGLATA